MGARRSALQRLWPLIALLQSPSDRMTAFANVWRAALDLHLETSAAKARGASASRRRLGGVPRRG